MDTRMEETDELRVTNQEPSNEEVSNEPVSDEQPSNEECFDGNREVFEPSEHDKCVGYRLLYVYFLMVIGYCLMMFCLSEKRGAEPYYYALYAEEHNLPRVECEPETRHFVQGTYMDARPSDTFFKGGYAKFDGDKCLQIFCKLSSSTDSLCAGKRVSIGPYKYFVFKELRDQPRICAKYGRRLTIIRWIRIVLSLFFAFFVVREGSPFLREYKNKYVRRLSMWVVSMMALNFVAVAIALEFSPSLFGLTGLKLALLLLAITLLITLLQVDALHAKRNLPNNFVPLFSLGDLGTSKPVRVMELVTAVASYVLLPIPLGNLFCLALLFPLSLITFILGLGEKLIRSFKKG